jgi:predicted thioesterase
MWTMSPEGVSVHASRVPRVAGSGGVEAFDQAGSIGHGEHVRAIIGTERLLAGVARRKAGQRGAER